MFSLANLKMNIYVSYYNAVMHKFTCCSKKLWILIYSCKYLIFYTILIGYRSLDENNYQLRLSIFI